MRYRAISMKYFLFLFLVVLISRCTKKTGTGDRSQQDSLARNINLSPQYLSGTFEYSEPIEESYLYLKIEMKPDGDSVKGHLWAGIYLAKSSGSGFSDPTVLAECSLKGIRNYNSIEMQLTVTKTERMEEEAPDLLGMMNFPDLDSNITATLWAFTYEQGTLVSQNGLLMPDGKSPVKFVWEKIK